MCSGELKLRDTSGRGSLDFETKEEYVVVVRVTDDGTPSRHAEAAVSIYVQDVNERPVVASGTATVPARQIR